MSFSKLTAIPKAVVGFGSDVSQLVNNFNKVSGSILELETPISVALNNFEDITHLIKDETLPLLSGSLEGVNQASSRFSKMFEMLERVVAPFLSAQKVLLETWSSIVKLLFSVLNKVDDGKESLLSFLASSLPDDIMLPLTIVVALSALVLLTYCLPASFISTITTTLTSVLLSLKGVVLGLMPAKWIPEWLSSFGEVVPQCLNAQGPATTTAGDLNAFTFSDALTSIFSIGFISIIYSVVGLNKPGRRNSNPISEILCATGDHASKINQLFIFFRNIKASLGDTLLWVGEWLCEMTGFASPLTATINAVLNTQLFQWFQEVQEVTSPQHRLENFACSNFVNRASLLRDRAAVFEAEFAKNPISPFVVTRFNYAITKLDKILSDANSHKGVGQFRDEPFCVQFYGKPGCGKTMSMNYFINDLLNRMGEPKRNRLYALSSKDGYWSNYNHQIAVLIDDFGQVLDAANQHDDVKDLIFLKSCAPMTLPMAAVEEKGMQFTSRYIFLTSNFASPQKTSGVMDIKAIQRRRNILVEVRLLAPLDADSQNPTEHMRFTLKESLEPFRSIAEYVDLDYFQLLDVVEMRCRQHWERSAWLNKFSNGLEAAHAVQHADGAGEAQAGISEIVDAADVIANGAMSFMLSSLQYAYKGKLSAKEPFALNSVPSTHFNHFSDEVKQKFQQWRLKLLTNGLSDNEIAFWREEIEERHRANFMAWLPMFTFDEQKFAVALATESGFMYDCVVSDDIDAFSIFQTANERSKFAFALILRNFSILTQLAKDKEVKSKPWHKKILEYIIAQWNSIPPIIRTAIKVYAMYQCASLAFGAISSFLPGACAEPVVTTIATTLLTPEVKSSGKGNVSGDESTFRGGAKRKTDRFLTAQATLGDEWAEWSSGDPFLNDALIKNVVVLRCPAGGIFRGIYVCSGWLLTVGHAFLHAPDGMVFTVVHQHSSQAVAFNKAHDFYKPIPNQDLCLINVGNIDGLKKNIIPHFARKGGIMCAVGSKAVLAKPIFSSETLGCLVKLDVIGVSMLSNGVGPVEYGDPGFMLSCQDSFSFQFQGQNGDCGSVLLAPGIGNRQPIICGIHCAGYVSSASKAGMVKSFASAIYRDVLEELIPSQSLVAQGPCPLLKQLRSEGDNPFEIKQVALLGQVPAQLAVNVPFKTTLRKSEIFELLETKLASHSTEPSILSARDTRSPYPFDPYVSGVEKFNETATCFNMEDARIVMDVMKQELLMKLREVAVPGGKPQVREESAVLNGVEGEKFYDAMDMSTSCGYPFNTMGLGTNKRGFLEGEPGDYSLDRTKAVFESFISLDCEIRMGLVPDMVTCECAKDERLPMEKIYVKPKTRLFTILPFHYNMLVRKYFLDFSATLMRAHNSVASKVGINPEGLEWTMLAHDFLNTSSVGFSADYSSFDGRAPVFIFQWFCDMVDEYYGDAKDSENSIARHALLMMASCHYTLCGDKLFRVVGGMPSGFSLTVLFNSLLNEFYMRYAFQRLLKKEENRARTMGLTQRDFNQLYVAIYGDDNLVAVPLQFSWYSLPSIAEELGKVNVIIKNGLDKSQDVMQTTFSPLQELTFLSRGFRRHVTGYFMAPLKWVSVVEPLRWIRPSTESPAIESLMENIEGSLRAAFMHGEQVFSSLLKVIQECLQERAIPMYSLPSYFELERNWLQEVSGEAVGKETILMHDGEINSIPEDVPTKEMFAREINKFVEGIYFCSSRTAKHTNIADYIFVNCVTAHHPVWIRGPVSWKDLENKIWAYTMGAIDIEVKKRLAQNMSTNLLFVCPGGIGMSIVCAALATLATAQYTRAQIVRRSRMLACTDKLSSFSNGAGHYILLAAQQGAVYKNESVAISYGSNLFDRSLRVGNCVIIVGNIPMSINPTSFWCTPCAGYCDVRTSFHYIRKVDPSASHLANALKRAKSKGDCLFLFFSVFKVTEAEWVLNAVMRTGDNIQNLCGTDLILLERQANLVSNASFGKIGIQITKSILGKNSISSLLWENEHEKFTQTLPFDSKIFADPEALRRAVNKLPADVYHTFSVVDAIKIMFTNKVPNVVGLQECVWNFYPKEETKKSEELVISLGLWFGLPMNQLSQAVSETFFYDVNRDLEFVTHDSVEDFWHENEEYSNSTEELSLSLRLNYQYSSLRNKHVFRLPVNLSLLAYTMLAVKLENKCRKKLALPLMEVPLWMPFEHDLLDPLSYISIDYILSINS